MPRKPSPIAMYIVSLAISLGPASALPYDSTNPSDRTLAWAPCDLDFPKITVDRITGPIDYATLEVPLHYTVLSSINSTLELQLIRHAATKEPFKGTVIFSPGGPGGSGIEQVATTGHLYRDEVFNGQCNVVGFDTRGTGRTIRFAFDPTKGSNVTTSFTSNAHPIRNNDATFASAAKWKVLKKKARDDRKCFTSSCKNTEGNVDVGRFLDTPFVVRDMVRLIDALAEDDKHRFWGRSYSIVLGQTFAAIFPDRVDRMLLDSNAFENWLLNCISTGPSLSPGIADFIRSGTTVQDIMPELAAVILQARRRPYRSP
ncbi:hypothetical protein DPSP01_011816 [Paraphaeosphaeria sporulosa]|uniref:Uncharacterized protein n=1 Tax=Paraphaeosphaeria sporulosa TaxID=1460663 RepID=A0A177CHP4_9PLEO|nr:uncharacterized protein CC84DRAFT_1217549 [Paraphaeosphaeria sporulosa]OAG06310.1 hypothetical protein CC84DRAFT_1217549 [Paraphaeosphaeria sporulosa]